MLSKKYQARKLYEETTGINLTNRQFFRILNKLRIHTKYESLKHFLAKAVVMKILFEKGRFSVSEAEFNNGRIVDVLDIFEKTGYEFESTGVNRKADPCNIVTFDLRKVPNDINEMYKWFKKRIP